MNFRTRQRVHLGQIGNFGSDDDIRTNDWRTYGLKMGRRPNRRHVSQQFKSAAPGWEEEELEEEEGE